MKSKHWLVPVGILLNALLLAAFCIHGGLFRTSEIATIEPTRTVQNTDTPTPTPTASTVLRETIPTLTLAAVIETGNQIPEQSDDGNAYNGYWWYSEGWVPGLVTFDTQFLRIPDVVMGSALFYAPEMAEAQMTYRGLLFNDSYSGMVAIQFCSEIGHTVWLQRPGHDWEGPFIVMDCSRRNDLYGQIMFRDQVVEVDFDTAVRWGLARYGGQQNNGRWSTLNGRLDGVLVSSRDPKDFNGVIIDLSVWFLQNVRYATASENRYQIQNYEPPLSDCIEQCLPKWKINGEWVSFP
jgi:hypothetical protein